MIPPTCTVLRSSLLAQIPASALVTGDVVLLRTGDKTPADMVLVAGVDLKVDNSSLTGESEPQERYAVVEGAGAGGGRGRGRGVRAVEAVNLVFNSTMVVSGEGWGGAFALLLESFLRCSTDLVFCV